jgi:hypothetical protein
LSLLRLSLGATRSGRADASLQVHVEAEHQERKSLLEVLMPPQWDKAHQGFAGLPAREAIGYTRPDAARSADPATVCAPWSLPSGFLLNSCGEVPVRQFAGCARISVAGGRPQDQEWVSPGRAVPRAGTE